MRKECGSVGDRHFVDAYNVVVHWWTKDVEGSAPPKWRRMQPPAEVAVPPTKLGIEAQKSRVKLVHSLIRNFRTD